MDTEKYFDYILSETQKILAIDSPSGFTRNVADYVLSAYRALGYEPVQTVKGGVFCEIQQRKVLHGNAAPDEGNG